MFFMCRFNSFSPGQKAILVGISGIHENPRFPPLSKRNTLSLFALLYVFFSKAVISLKNKQLRSYALEPAGGMVQAWVGHFVSSITLP